MAFFKLASNVFSRWIKIVGVSLFVASGSLIVLLVIYWPFTQQAVIAAFPVPSNSRRFAAVSHSGEYRKESECCQSR
jgi:hypothetical protein